MPYFLADFWGFFRNINEPMIYYALLAGILITVISPLVGSVVVIRRLSFIADTLSHFSLAGAALGAYIGAVFANARIITSFPPVIITIAFSLLGTILVEQLRNVFENYKELSMPIVLSLGAALAAIFIAKSKGNTQNVINTYLFGSIFALNKNDILTMLAASLVILAFLIAFRSRLITMCFDETYARVSGIRVSALRWGFTIVLSLFISVFMKAVGVLLISALMIIPVATAIIAGHSLKHTIFVAMVTSFFAMILGFWFSYPMGVTAGPVIVIFNIIFFLIAVLGRNLRRRHRKQKIEDAFY